MLLVPVIDVMVSMGIGPELEEDVTPSITAGIEAATTRLETEMDTSLRPGTGRALFYVDPNAFSGIAPNGTHRLLLEAGFLRAQPTLLLSDALGNVVGSAQTGGFVTDLTLGVVLVDPGLFAGRYVVVEHEAGFSSAEELKLNHPWVREALISYVPMVMNARRTDSGEGTGQSPLTSNYRLKGDLAQGLIGRYNRKLGFTFRPIWSQWTPAPSTPVTP